jgi:PAS domain-containing protein
MTQIDATLAALKATLCREIDATAVRASNPVAHKWKAPWRCLILREVVAWRLHDLLTQSRKLACGGEILGARILLRSAFETLAMLVYANRSMRNVVKGNVEFHTFSERTSQLLLGSRDKTTSHESVGVLSMLQSADKRYPGMMGWYEALCESAHPNFEGLLHAYADTDEENNVTRFENRWNQIYGTSHADALKAVLIVFEGEYNDEWPDAFKELEEWVERNDSLLEATRPTAR